MLDNYNALIKNGTWILVPKPTGVNIVRSMWLFKHKFHANGTLSRYKARLVANGSSQQQGIDVDDTFSPVVKPATICTVLSLAVSRKWPIHQLNVKNAFLNGYAIRAGFYHSRCDTSLFIYQQGSQVAYLLIYVDDIILTASSATLLQQIITSLHQEFDMTDLGALNYFLGVSATRSSTGVNMVHSMWLFKHKFHANETLSRYKPWLVANGSSQQQGIDVDETFSPVVKPATIRTVPSLAVSRKWPIYQLDVKNAFLNAFSIWTETSTSCLVSTFCSIDVYKKCFPLKSSSSIPTPATHFHNPDFMPVEDQDAHMTTPNNYVPIQNETINEVPISEADPQNDNVTDEVPMAYSSPQIVPLRR
nr:ribonuclease H-like domain-containing protein [Tanacetum cinerariifolium]